MLIYYAYDNPCSKGQPNTLIYASTGQIYWEYIPDEPFCMWCGSKNVEEWSEDNPVCPKCGGVMQKLDK